jgi:hypothetical protein
MITIRRGTFETNSSSAHSITIMSETNWEDFKNLKKFIITGISKYADEDGCYGMEGQFLLDKDFIGIKEVKEQLEDSDVDKNILDMSDEDFTNEVRKNKDLQYALYDLDIIFYDDDWTHSNITKGNLGVGVVCVSMEVEC